jgi:hypothetical protein
LVIWAVCFAGRDDGLNDPMQAVLDAQKAAADSAAAKVAAASKQSAAAGIPKSSSPAGSAKGGEAAAGVGSAKKNPLEHAVQLLAGMR